jgi:hypothetical protein
MVSTGNAAELTAAYDGEALREHRMRVRDLAPALLALERSFERANALLNGERATLGLSIKANESGSFEIVMVLEQLARQTVAFFSDDVITSAVNIKELFFGDAITVLSLFGVMKRSKGQPIEVTGDEDQDGNVTVEIDRLRVKVPSKVAVLALDSLLKSHLNHVVQPLMKTGIDSLTFRDGDRELETIVKDDLPSFRSLASTVDGTIISESILPSVALQPEMVRFRQGRKWRFHDGAKSHFYDISDPEFERQVLEGRRFGGDDLLICEVRVIQYIDRSNKLRTSHEITRVTEQTRISHGLEGQPRLPEEGSST